MYKWKVEKEPEVLLFDLNLPAKRTLLQLFLTHTVFH